VNNKEDELCVVTEIGIFGTLNIPDPTKKKINKDDSELGVLIEESIQNNSQIKE
jgi:hypothetical protein